MPTFSNKKTLPYSANDIYKMILDVEKYPEFLPWCKQVKIAEIISSSNLTADLLVNFKSFFEKYRSNIKHGKDNNNIFFVDAVAIDGPFKKLISNWRIESLSLNECRIDFFIDFQFNSFFLEKMIGSFFEKAAIKMVNAFEDRAKALYEKNKQI